MKVAFHKVNERCLIGYQCLNELFSSPVIFSYGDTFHHDSKVIRACSRSWGDGAEEKEK